MTTDRYLKLILTVIACELLWLGIRDAAPPVLAQQEPTPVIVTGFRIENRDYPTVPVAIVGGWEPVPGHRESHMLQPVKVRVTDPVRLDAREPIAIREPLTVETGVRALLVQSVPAQPAPRPGH